jgi:hypothetical protein
MSTEASSAAPARTSSNRLSRRRSSSASEAASFCVAVELGWLSPACNSTLRYGLVGSET